MDLDSISKVIQDKTGISREHADMAVRLVLEKVREKALAPLQGIIDQLLKGESPAGEAGIAGMLGGIMGGKG